MQTIKSKYIQKVYSNASWLTIDTTAVSFDRDTIIIANHCSLDSLHFTDDSSVYHITYIRVFTELDGYIGSIEHNIDGFFWRECNASNNLQ